MANGRHVARISSGAQNHSYSGVTRIEQGMDSLATSLADSHPPPPPFCAVLLAAGHVAQGGGGEGEDGRVAEQDGPHTGK